MNIHKSTKAKPRHVKPEPQNDLAGLVSTTSAQLTRVWDNESPERLYHLCKIALAIHDLDFNKQTGRTTLYGRYPANSIRALRDFLHDPKQRELLETIKSEVRNFNKQNDIAMMGIFGTRLAWFFLDHFSLGRCGPLEAFAHIPKLDEDESELQIIVCLPRKSEDIRPRLSSAEHVKAEQALGWILNAPLQFPEDLGLTEKSERWSGR